MLETNNKTKRVTDNQRQTFLLNSALIGFETDGKEFLPKLDNISFLKSKIGGDFLSNEEKKILFELTNYVGEIISYYSAIDKRVVDREDITSARFLAYQEALSRALYFIFDIDEIFEKLLNEALDKNIFGLEKFTIPSNYWGYLIAKMTKKPIEDIQRATGIYPISLREVQEEREYKEEEEREE